MCKDCPEVCTSMFWGDSLEQATDEAKAVLKDHHDRVHLLHDNGLS
jgi:hypothetical protein